MALPAKVPDPPIGSTTTLGQANITTPQPSTTTSTTTNTRSYLDVATATPAPGQVPVVLFSNLPTSTDRVWRESTSRHSVFFTPPTDSTLTYGDDDQDSQNILTDDEMADGDHS
ncbi:hypothetical protein PHYBLDRAFT_142123 [Phycomyces blakesleeanus NRRL 1555(-)]|uniref:Uncharacterized protein n=1 Tax=Phycomyces blakesleeanus (strain ATCC 8743b / DSM 1359 / FGSC 10004 / NBRC 33097 / NRRL 1555) TaxID=763407 RepID=A0A167NU57_PHYB8|nr:hypothetical protein PHYBLDRAFT_171673 [Phycomyces blakesleeanus NRRL 1555(-)]XP_018294649.1 hypothetical protein PHYBLDRAFT_142123 [Phycomyces blakesleeanus NRRL 1555(-)]OAD70290.1 hypothetical protein PHYBLDRAFT_171673 [Phycomyces blakesleeanus NRRL 1555(-)]OAD76609.1 hypothetical protein PHYBLDRAFT_142123 [Phycomyces blakesleeanus NRRL 1555(-)]|eukprot:XP_018288330.1 hypothetical protein PHYBLDRAFT_171673 [Phycomyces blakesleeanus NRRL 1555(-)]